MGLTLTFDYQSMLLKGVQRACSCFAWKAITGTQLQAWVYVHWFDWYSLIGLIGVYVRQSGGTIGQSQGEAINKTEEELKVKPKPKHLKKGFVCIQFFLASQSKHHPRRPVSPKNPPRTLL